jgi:peptide/nickel transport system ATP-binding protein
MVCATCSIRIFGIEMPEPVPTPLAGPAATLEIEGLTIEFRAHGGLQRVVDRVDLRICPGEIVGLIGESGSGKTLTALSVLGLLPRGARIRSGSIRLSGTSLLDLSEDEWRAIRGDRVAFIPQDALRALNPVFPVRTQVGEPLKIHRGTPWQIAKRKAIELLRSVHLRDPEQRAEEYPHQFSGGMQQRAMVAMGLALEPQLLIADEPTTALDVTVQAQVLKLVREIRDAHGASILFITHDLGVVADLCDRVYVMYAGLVVEEGSVESLFTRPSHPYTQALLRATPTIRAVESELVSIAGQIPSPGNLPTGCRFADRCPVAFERCGEEPPAFDVGGSHLARCWRCAAPQ